ncbi:hypothetical protein MSEO_26440 [Mycobacterium seoulense]|uniref:Uncharacterized protein n=1 Tax=Mycobacterium seoulense TaxID=386911 RepID=A0A7I7P082_9MYCO|nr:hypothetical protein MSEO_26440 [Mycobacterium seoulense]
MSPLSVADVSYPITASPARGFNIRERNGVAKIRPEKRRGATFAIGGPCPPGLRASPPG